ncbi:MAG: DUF3179 domain-containing protein [Thermoleophilaceae bacterium]|nr:DUF3179 domain-containing protein [Thermoleophilaceae bacterium]
MRRFLAPSLLLLAVGVAACGEGAESPGSGTGAGSTSAQPDAGLGIDTAGWKTDFSEHSVPLSEFVSGGPPRDGIPPIDEPSYVSQDEAEDFLSDREPVLVVEQSGEARAYPLQILVWHEIVNDELEGRPIAVTYCPLCNSSVVFDRRVGGDELTFGTTGNLRNSDLVMWDRQTESWWQQLTAEAVVGELTGTKLEVLPAQTLSFEDFRAAYPQGDVLSRDTGFQRDYGTNPYVGYDETAEEEPFLFEGETDNRLPPKARVTALFSDDETLVIPFERLEAEPVVNEDVGGGPAVVFYDPEVASTLDEETIADSRSVGTAAAFERRVGRRELTFELRGDRFVDRETGSEWDITGRAVSGPLAGEELRPIRHDEQFWFALAAFLPDAEIAR